MIGGVLKANLDSFLGSQLSPDSVGISPLLLSLSTLLPQRRIGPWGCFKVAHLVSGGLGFNGAFCPVVLAKP